MTPDDDPHGEPDDEGTEERAPADQATVDASDPKAHAKVRRRATRELEEAERFWRGVLADPVGRREIWSFLNRAHTFEIKLGIGPNGFPQPEASWIHAGERNIGQALYLLLARMDREGVLMMHDEHDPEFIRHAKLALR